MLVILQIWMHRYSFGCISFLDMLRINHSVSRSTPSCISMHSYSRQQYQLAFNSNYFTTNYSSFHCLQRKWYTVFWIARDTKGALFFKLLCTLSYIIDQLNKSGNLYRIKTFFYFKYSHGNSWPYSLIIRIKYFLWSKNR